MRLACSRASRCVRAGTRCYQLALRRVRPLRCPAHASAPPGTLGVPPLPFPDGPRNRFEVVCLRPHAWSSSVTPSVWVRPFAAGVAATMASADSSRFAVATGGPSPLPLSGSAGSFALSFPPVRPPGVRHTPFPSSACRIYVHDIRAAIGLRLAWQPHPPRPPDAVRVPQAEGLPPASFGFRLATDTLAIGCALPAAGRARDFHPLGVCHARHTKKVGPARGRTRRPSHRWRRGESNSGPKQNPGRCLQAQSQIESRTRRTLRHALGVPVGSSLAFGIPTTSEGASP